MGIALAAHHFYPAHEEAAILFGFYVLFRKRCPETRPARAGIELRLRVEQIVATAHTLIDPLFFTVPVGPGKGPLGTLLPADMKLLRSKLPLPFLVGFRNPVFHFIPFPSLTRSYSQTGAVSGIW